MKTSLAQLALVVLSCTIILASKTDDVNLCKRQPFRGRCPSVKGKGQMRSQFVLRYYLRDNKCVSYPFGHCANDENEPMLYRYKEECEKACLSNSNSDDTATENDNITEKSASSLGNKITESDTDTGTTSTDADTGSDTGEQVSTTAKPFSENTSTISSQRAAFTVQKNTSHKLLTECERRKQASESGLIKTDFIPICTADGSFRPLQCETQGGNCFCVDHNGIKIPNSDSNGTMKPNCKRIIEAQKPLTYECVSPMDSGPCSAAIPRWYYDDREKQCIQFEYSGCGGNGNNYPTRVECEKQCQVANNEVKCKDGLEPLKNGNGQLVNCKDTACPNGYLCSIAQLGSACCPINASSNIASDICQLPKERGPCDQYELRFYYNSRLGECKYFFFGGCEGNANNFERVEECERICRQRGAKVAVTSVVSAPQLITSGPQMRKLNKEFGTKNIKKTSQESELIELTDDATSVKYSASSISDITENADVGATTNEATLKIKETNASSSTSMSHDRSTSSKDLSVASINQSKLYLHKEIRQKGTKTSLDSSITGTTTDFTIVEPQNTTVTFGNSENFTASGNESNRNISKFSSESVTITGQQLSTGEERIRMSSSTSRMTTTRRPNIISGGEERLSNKSKSSSIPPSSTSPTALSPSSTITSRSITSSATELLVPQQAESGINDRCFQKRDRGTCTGQFIRWHWDPERNTCQVFTYSGCDGNGNNFRSREDCFAACHKPPQPVPRMNNVCEHSIHPGDCTGVFQRFAFDSTIGDCRPFTYTGCGGNGNNFGSSLECRNKCVTHRPTLSTNICEHPIEVGECSGVFSRFAYDLVTNECRPFTYGGCGGNGNNFGSMDQCKKACVRAQPDVSVQCPVVDISLCVEPCILFSNRRGCHECTCPVAHSATENGLVESSTFSPTVSDTSSTDEPKALETEQFMKNKVEKKHESTPHPKKISQINAATELGEKCSQPMDVGPCKNFIERWFFDMDSGLCQSFQYGGCAGNRNHFFSKHECEIHCARFFNGRTGRRRIAAHQNALHAQHNTIMWSQSAEILNESEEEDMIDNQESTVHRSSSNDVPSPSINISQNVAKANSWRHVTQFDPENRRHAGAKLMSATSQSLKSNTELNALRSLQHGNNKAMQDGQLNATTFQNFSKGSVREQQPWSIPSRDKVDTLISGSNIQQQTITDYKKQVSMETTKQQDAHRHQINDKSTQSNVSRITSNASKSEIISVQENTQTESTRENISTPMNFSEWDRGNLTLQERQSQTTVQKIDTSQIQQQNGLSQETSSEQQILQHDTQSKNIEDITSTTSNLFDSRIAKQTFTDFTTVQNSKTSTNEQITSLPQAKISESQIARTITNDHDNELKKEIESTRINEALIVNSGFDNSVNDDYKIPIDQNGERLILDKIATSMNSFSPRSEANNQIHMQLNSINEPLKEQNQLAKKVTDNSVRENANSQFINTQLSHKEYDGAVAVATHSKPIQRDRDYVLRHHVRIINHGSALQTFSSLSPSLLSNSPPSLSVSLLPTLSSTILSPSSSTTSPSALPSSISLSSSSLSSPLILSDTEIRHNIFPEISHSNVSNKNESFNGAQGTNLKHATDGQIVPSNTEEFSHDSVAMHINTRENKGRKVIASNEKEVTEPATLNNFNTIADVTVTQERSDILPVILPKDWDLDSDGYKIIDKIDITSQGSLSHESLVTTITPSTTISSAELEQTLMENAVPLLTSISTTLNSTPHVAPTSVSSMTSINHTTLSSVTTTPANNNITSTSEMIAESESTIVERSFESSIPSSLEFLSQPIPSGKSWLYDGLHSIINSQVLPKQYSRQQELSEKKLSFGSFEPVGTFALATFSTAINKNNNPTTTVMNTSRVPPMPTDNPTIRFTSIQKLLPDVMDTSVSNVELQAKKSVGQSGKSIKESEENYFNADSSIFMNAPNFQNHTLTVLSPDRIRKNNTDIMTKEPEFILHGTKEIEKERSEGRIGTMDLLSIRDFDDTSIKPENDILNQFAIIQRTATEVPASVISNSEADVLPNQDHRVDIVEGHSLHLTKHQELQQSPTENLNEITEQQFIASHNTQVAHNISLRTTVKQGEIEELQRDQTTVDEHQEEKMESKTLNQQNISDLQVTPETTTHASRQLYGVTSLQKLQPEEDDTCVLPPDAGTCRDYVPRWFYNSQTGKCEQFSYGSCGGNNNNFHDRQACERKCSRSDSIRSQLPERCTYKKDEGYSNGYNVKWYFNVRNLRCEQMVYQGQGGNSNQFETFGECQTFCTPLDGKAPEMDTTTKQIEHSLKTSSIGRLQPHFAASQDQKNQKQQAVSITGTDRISEDQHNIHDISQNAGESHHRSVVSDNDSIGDKEIQQISSKQLPILTQSPISVTPAQVFRSLDTSRNETMTAPRSSPKPSSFANAVNQSSDEITEKKVGIVKVLGSTTANKDNDATVDLNVFEDIGHTPSCPNGLKPIQHEDGRPMMCLPGRNQCSSNSLCYFNGVDFFCCPNAEDPYDEHVFGGYGGEEVKRGYKNVKKTPINDNELIVRKLRLKRRAQVVSSHPSTINTAARIDSNVQHSLTRASLVVNNSDAKQVDNICMQDVNVGKCTEAHLRFFYDHRVNTCRLFYYSGCDGNDNNFVTEDECRQRCKSDKVYIEDAPPGSCPFGEVPLGDNAPVICGKNRGSFECPKGYYCRMGPPNVCCLEKSLPGLEKILVTKKNQKNIRFSPQQSSRTASFSSEEAQGGYEAENSPSLVVPTNICPDGSDALLDESTQQPLKCGLGYDGESFCPVGYYCSIDSEKNGRLCCQLGIMGVKIPPPPIVPPYFGLRPSNPGEVIPRGSLPSDHISRKHHKTGISNTVERNEGYSSRSALRGTKLAIDVKRLSGPHTSEKKATDSSGNFVPFDEETDSLENFTPSNTKLQDEVYGRMMLKSKDQIFRTQALNNAMSNVISPETETNEVQIDIGEMKDPFESLEYTQKTTSDGTVCLLKPNEGRTCREDESPPRTNLQYFYSNRDKRCKLYFYRGCGGSKNRFDTKRHCELTCAGV
ncbi:Kunitz/Bovine pancreatic trypsin inhibitor domain family protein [Acanthocheilonema viteae]